MPNKRTKASAPWKRVIIQRSVLAGYSKGPKPVKKLAKALKNQQTQSAYYEKLKDRDGLASGRLNGADRALLLEFEVDGEKSLVIADIAENHEYKKSPLFSDKAGVEKYRQKYGPSIIRQIKELMAQEALEAARPAAGPVQKRPLVTLDYYNQRVIRLSSQQEEILKVKPPVVIRGAAGSGKSCLAVSRILELIASLPPDSAGKILYVTQSPELVKAMQAIWDSLSLPDTLKNRVEFKAYETVAREQRAGEFEGKTLAKDADFEQWLKGYVAKCRDRLKPAAAAAGKKGKGKKKKVQVPDDANAQLDGFLKEGHELYQEFRLLSGYLLPEGYLGLGTQNSLYAHQDDRQWILAAYENYQNYLKDQRLVALDFLKFKPRDQYDLVLGDEAQDLSGLELENLLLLAKEGQLCLCMDTHQSLFDELSKGPLIENMMQRYGLALASVELPHSYRCPENVVHFANEVIKVKNQVVGGRADKHELSEIKMSPEQAKTPGIVHWLKQSPEELKALRDMAKQSNFAIITLPEYKKEAQEKYPGAVLVFTAEEIKGLEYENVILYRMLDNDLCREASREWTDGKVPTNRVKRGCGDSRFGPPLNKFFTSSTRATKRLFIDQGDDYPLAPLCNAFKKGIKTPETAFLSDPNLEQTEAERLTQWEEEICRLYLNGKKDLARNAFDRCLKENRSNANYDNFLLTKGLIKKEEPPAEKQEVIEEQKVRTEILPAVAEAAEPSQKKEVLQKEKAAPRSANKKQAANSQPKQEDKGKQAAVPKAKPKETTASLPPKPDSSANTNKKSNSTLPFGPLVRSPAFFNPSPSSRITGISDGRGILKATLSTVPAKVPEVDPAYQKMKGFLDNVFGKSGDTALDRYFSCKDESCFLIMMHKDETKWRAFRKYLEEHESSLSQWFSLQKLFETAPDGGKSRFETIARNPVGLEMLELIFSLVPIDLDVSSIFKTMCQLFFPDIRDLNWSEMTAENHFLIHLAGSADGISLLQTIIESSFFPGMKLQDKSGNTFLHWAIENNREDLASIIISSRHAALPGGDRIIPGVNPKVIFRVANKLNLTPLNLAKSKNAESLIPLLEAREKRILEAEHRRANRWSPYPNLQMQPVSRILFPGDDLSQMLGELENKGPS